jgi:hypothetical protein
MSLVALLAQSGHLFLCLRGYGKSCSRGCHDGLDGPYAFSVAFGGKADMAFCGANVRFGPKADIPIGSARKNLGRERASSSQILRIKRV